MSASMYNSPYVYKEPLPKIKYPPFFSGCTVSFKHFLDSKFLALASLLFTIAFVVSLIVIISPFWFKLVLNAEEGTFGDEAVKRKLSINTGLFYINEDKMDNLMELNKNNNQDVAPLVLVGAQYLEMVSVCSLVACLAATVILVLRRFASIPAYFILAFFSSITGIFFLLVSIFALITAMQSDCDPYDTGDSCKYEDNLAWRVFPIYPQHYRVAQKVTPYIKLNWGFYISVLVPILTIAGSVLLWLEAIMAHRQLDKIRYNQLRSVRDPHEGDINPADHHKYVYRPPVQAGPMSYGMQPVMFQGGPPQQRGVVIQAGPYGGPPQQQGVMFQGDPYGHATAPYPQQQEQGRSVGFSGDPYESKQRQVSSSSPPAGRRRSPPPTIRRRSPSPDSGDDSPPPTRFGRVRRGGGGSPPPSHRRRSPSPPSSAGGRRRSPPRRGGPPSLNSSVSEGPYISREIDL